MERLEKELKYMTTERNMYCSQVEELQEENAKLKKENEFLNKEFKINKMFNKLFKIALEDENGAIDKIFDILRKEFKEVE